MMTMTTEAAAKTVRTHNAQGFDRNRIHKDTGTHYGPDGFDMMGYDKDGFHRTGSNNKGFTRDGMNENGTRFDKDGFDIHGFNADGWMVDPYGWQPDLNTWLRSEYSNRSRVELPIHRETGTAYATDGFNYYGFDRDGYDRDGFSRGGDSGVSVMTDREGFYPNGFNERGFARDGYNARGLDSLGFTRERLHATTGTVWSPDGIHGLTGTGYDADGYDEQGWDDKGFGRDGYAYDGFNADGIHKETGTRYDPKGFTRARIDINGLVRYSNRDLFGYETGERAPSRVYYFSGWNHHLRADKLKTDDTDYDGRVPRNLYREGWRHEAAQGWNADKGCYELEMTFTHKDTGTDLNPDGFSILGINLDTRLNERGFNVDTRIHSVTGTEFDESGWNYTRTELAPR